MITLTLKQNAFHTLRHAIEHLSLASAKESANERRWDYQNEGLVWTRDGSKMFMPAGPLAKRPAAYNLPFALLHLIQASELLLKAHLVEAHGPASILENGGPKTITIYKALKLTASRVVELLTVQEWELLCRANELRNHLQHHELAYREAVLRGLCIDFLAVCCLLSQKLLGVNVVSELMYDPWTDEQDPLGNMLSEIAGQLSGATRPTTDKIAADWLARNPQEETMLCIACGSRAFVPITSVCVACGAEGDVQTSVLVYELIEVTDQIVKARQRRGPCT